MQFNFVGQIADHGGNGFGGRVIESIAVMLFDDRTLSKENQDLEGTSEGIHEAGEEEEGAPLEEAGCCWLDIVEDTGDDERHGEIAQERTDS